MRRLLFVCKLKIKMVETYINEALLGKFLHDAFPEVTFARNKSVPHSNIKCRPDYRCDSLMLIVEFDGYRHYCDTNTILRDNYKDVVYSKLGYEVIRVPYFIQLDAQVVKLLFSKYSPKIAEFNKYPHGFIDANAMQPYDYCIAGLSKFKQDLAKFECVSKQILDTIDYSKITLLDEFTQNVFNNFKF